MNMSIPLDNQLMATKFFVPVAPGTLIPRPHLIALLDKGLMYPLTLVAAAAGFGKTTLLSTWTQSRLASHPQVVWLSLDEEDNEPRLFWTYILTALNKQQPERFDPLLRQLQLPQASPLKYILTAFINLLIETEDRFVLILDDYQVITEEQVHTSLLYLIERLPPQLRIVLSTRADPPLSLSLLQAHKQILEVRTDQLRCTAEETGVFFKEVMGIDLPGEIIEQVTARTEGWLVGLQLLGFSLLEHADPRALIEQVSGDQRYIMDYLTEEVLQRQPKDVQMFLLCTSLLEHLTASLCDAVMPLTGSQQMLERFERANLFIVSLDSKRQWYRYHALFAEALRRQLELTDADLVPILHHRASLWYAQHNQSTQAILHAFSARQWQWAADLIEHLPLMAFTCGANQHELVLLHQWLQQLPAEVVHARPRLCLACAQLLWAVAPYTKLEVWLGTAEAKLTASLAEDQPNDLSHPLFLHQERHERENLLGEVIAFDAFLRSDLIDGETVLARCQQALSLLSLDNLMVRALVASTQLRAFYASLTNDAVRALESGLQASSLAQAAGLTTLAISLMGTTTLLMIGTGRLHETRRLTQRAMMLGRELRELVLPEVGWPTLLQAEILREWNQLDTALSLAQEAIELCKQTTSLASLVYTLYGYAILLRIYLSRADIAAAYAAFQQFEQIGTQMNLPTFLSLRAYFTTIDQVGSGSPMGNWGRQCSGQRCWM